MLTHHDPDEWESVVETVTCPYHEAHPNDPAWPGCTCSTVWGQRRRDPEAVAKIKADRRRKEEDEILLRADAIRAARKGS